GESDRGVTVGKRAVDFAVDGVNGGRFVLSEHRGEVVVVEFMTTWCGFCQSQLEVFKRLGEIEEVVIVSIDVDVNMQPSAPEEWAAERGASWFHGHDLGLGRTYEVSEVPTVIIVDKEGVIRYRGAYTPFDKLQRLIRQLQ
ncbi:hypothetical protein DRO42_06380, partial [Candidatus Bathyarchaeota archaeon]